MAGHVSECCQTTAAEADAGFCGECGKPIMRCMAYSECHGLVGEDGLCSVCVSPQLLLDKDAVRDVKVGGAIALPLIFANTSPTGRPLFITNIWTRLGDGARRPQQMDWERVEAGQSIRAVVQTTPLETMGRVRFDIAFTAATRWTWREEQFAFVSAMELDVEQGGGIVVNQTINASGAGGGSDTIYAPVRLENGGDVRRREGAAEAVIMPLVRGPKIERETGVRGYSEGPLKGAVVSRAAKFFWRGFADGSTPKAGPITTPESLFRMGRARNKAEGGDADVRLLVVDQKGKLDENLSRAISRRHIDLFIESGRLCLLAAGEAGVKLNDRVVPHDRKDVLQDGDVVRVLPKYGEALQLQVRMKANYGSVDEITIVRTPSINGDGSR
jgi:hypothetical protein